MNFNTENAKKIGNKISAGWGKIARARLKGVPDYYPRLNKVKGESYGNS